MPRTLLLADDSVTIQKVVGISFANEDIRLVTVDNGDDAITRVHEERPDLVLADVVMPGKSGYEVCEAIKSDAALSHIPVLLLSGTFEAFDDDRAQRAGADGHITKPFEAQTLVDRVNQLLSAHSAAAPGAPAEASQSESFDFFDDETPLADAGETTVVASDDLEFGAGDDAFVFDSSDPLSEAQTDRGLGSPSLDGSPDPWSSDPDLDRTRSDGALADDGLDDLGLDRPAATREPDPLAGLPRQEPSAADAVRALGLEPPPAPHEARPAQAAETRLAVSDFDVSSSDLGEPLAEPPEAPGPPAVSQDALRAQVVDALEKIAWEAFGDLTDQLVKQTVAKVEAIAWEVIPEMAERLVREEIEKLRDDD